MSRNSDKFMHVTTKGQHLFLRKTFGCSGKLGRSQKTQWQKFGNILMVWSQRFILQKFVKKTNKGEKKSSPDFGQKFNFRLQINKCCPNFFIPGAKIFPTTVTPSTNLVSFHQPTCFQKQVGWWCRLLLMLLDTHWSKTN